MVAKRLTTADAQDIFDKISAGHTSKELEKQYGISSSLVSCIKNKRPPYHNLIDSTSQTNNYTKTNRTIQGTVLIECCQTKQIIDSSKLYYAIHSYFLQRADDYQYQHFVFGTTRCIKCKSTITIGAAIWNDGKYQFVEPMEVLVDHAELVQDRLIFQPELISENQIKHKGCLIPHCFVDCWGKTSQ